MHTYLVGLGIDDASPTEISRWWRTRSSIAHGEPVAIDLGDLSHLIAVFQTALRRTTGAEPFPPAALLMPPRRPEPPRGEP